MKLHNNKWSERKKNYNFRKMRLLLHDFLLHKYIQIEFRPKTLQLSFRRRAFGLRNRKLGYEQNSQFGLSFGLNN